MASKEKQTKETPVEGSSGVIAETSEKRQTRDIPIEGSTGAIIETKSTRDLILNINSPHFSIEVVQQETPNQKPDSNLHLHLHFEHSIQLPLHLHAKAPFEIDLWLRRPTKGEMASASGIHVTSTSAAQSSRFSYVFFVQPDRQVGYLRGPLTLQKQDPQDAKPYKVFSVSLSANNVSAHQDSTQVSALIYEYQGVTKIRVYYINDQGELAELCADENDKGPGQWSDGSLNDSGFVADPKTMLTSSVDFSGKGQLKLFYQKKLNGFLQCAWVTTGNSGWNQQEINQRWDF